MKNISLKGIILGTLATIVLDILGGIVLMMIFFAPVGGGPGEKMDTASAVAAMGAGFLISYLIFSTATTVVGGYIAAGVAQRSAYLNSGIIGVIGILLGVFFCGDYPAWFSVLGFASVMPAALLGGYLADCRA